MRLSACALLCYVLPACTAELPPIVRGLAVVHLQAGAGPLTITLQKRDLNIYADEDELVADLYDPHRVLVGTVTIPDDGQAGKGPGPGQAYQTAELLEPRPRPGIYLLQIRAPTSNDLVWGLTTSAGKYMVQGWPLFNNPDQPATIYFQPPVTAFGLTISSLHQPGRQTVPLKDAAGQVAQTFDLQELGQDQTWQAPADPARAGWWSLELAKPDVKLAVQQVVAWTADAAAGFALEPYRFQILPYQATRYLVPGQTAQVVYQLRNTTGQPRVEQLALELPDGVAASLDGPAEVTVPPRGLVEVPVTVRLTKPLSNAVRGQIVVRAADSSSSAALFLKPGPAPVDQPLQLPLKLEAYLHENGQFGYAPDYAPNEVYFDPQNRPFMRHRTDNKNLTLGVQVLEDGGWTLRSFVDALKATYPSFRGTSSGGGFASPKVAFDSQGGVYTLVRAITAEGTRATLLYSTDRGRQWQAYDLGTGDFNLEQFTGHNAAAAPPAILIHTQTKPHPAPFCGYHDLKLYLPRKVAGGLELGEPVLVSQNDVGACQHSGGPAATATKDGRTHIVWGEVAPDDAPGVPTYVATYDHATRRLGAKVMLGYAPPVNDVHNVPAIALDSKGTLHIVLGAHGQPFGYRASRRPNDAYGGFTDLVPVLSAGRIDQDSDADGRGGQTYISLVCGPDDTLHIAFRQWRQGVDPYFGGGLYAALSTQSKRPGQPWGPAQPMVAAVRPGYSIYYHKLTIDRRGGLWLSYCYYTADTTYQDDFPELHSHRAVMGSRDGGRTWKLATTADFEAAMR